MASNTQDKYFNGLTEDAKARYKAKIELISGLDPYTSSLGQPCDSVPPVEACDLVSYLVLQTSYYTSKQFKARKSLEAYNQFVSGWIKDVKVWDINGRYLVKGQVKHSQRLTEPPLNPWIIMQKTGEICCGHCNCMAGLGETCTHIASVLFFLEAASRVQGKESCTQQICKWIMPSFMKNVQYLPVANIDFTSASSKKKKLDNLIDNGIQSNDVISITSSAGSNQTQHKSLIPHDHEMESFYHSLSKSDSKPAILSLIKPYSDKYIPTSSSLPPPLTSLYMVEYCSLPYLELLEVCQSIDIPELTPSEAEVIFNTTIAQHQSKEWFRYRAGRVTASRMKSVCRTNPSNPSQSLIKCICYPDQHQIKSKATKWGCSHEKEATVCYIEVMKKTHTNFTFKESGFVINPQWNHIGASPDGKIFCDCHGFGVLEIKCPYCHKGQSIKDAVMHDSGFCLVHNSDTNSIHLSKTHSYYYQVQTQLFVCDVMYCDFVVCTFANQESNDDLHIERVFKDDTLWNDCLSKASTFFRLCILPELLGKWYTKPIDVSTSSDCATTTPSNVLTTTSVNVCTQESHSVLDVKDVYCYCRGPDEDAMIACDNENCKIEWFHLKCLQINNIPRNKWYCPDCRRLPEFSKSKKRIRSTI